MDDTILDDWFTKSQAAAVLQVSEKTIERLATKGEIRRATRKRSGVRPSPVYCPEDLDRVKNAQTAQVTLIGMDGGDDHGHLLVEYPPKVAVSSLVNSLKACPVACCAKSDPTSRNATGKACSGRRPTSLHPAEAHRSPSCASTLNSSRHLSERPNPRTAAPSALSFPGLKTKACRAPGQASRRGASATRLQLACL